MLKTKGLPLSDVTHFHMHTHRQTDAVSFDPRLLTRCNIPQRNIQPSNQSNTIDPSMKSFNHCPSSPQPCHTIAAISPRPKVIIMQRQNQECMIWGALDQQLTAPQPLCRGTQTHVSAVDHNNNNEEEEVEMNERECWKHEVFLWRHALPHTYTHTHTHRRSILWSTFTYILQYTTTQYPAIQSIKHDRPINEIIQSLPIITPTVSYHCRNQYPPKSHNNATTVSGMHDMRCIGSATDSSATIMQMYSNIRVGRWPQQHQQQRGRRGRKEWTGMLKT